MRAFLDQLRRHVDGDVLDDPASRALYSADASNYRHVPRVVVRPRTTDAVVAAVGLAAEHRVPITSRGAGTSVAGNACGTGLVLDFSRYLTAVEVSGDRALVQPGAVLDEVNARAGAYLFGPDPSTHSRCTIGGMIGNNACGAHSVKWGKTSENVTNLDVLTVDGRRFGTTCPPELRLPTHDPAWFPALSRRVSGYALDAPTLTQQLVGTEGTCVVLLGAELKLVRRPERRVLVVLGFADTYAAADHVTQIEGALAVEGIDDALARSVRTRPDLPEGRSWLFVEVEDHPERVARTVKNSMIVHDPAQQRALWRIREDGAGLATRMPDGGEAWSGWEDAAVPPERLGAYLREFDRLLARHGRRGITYGHFGEGCLHVRIDFDLARGYREFLEDAADLVVSHGGSLSGEHGDGQARSELLSRMYPPAAIRAFQEFKHAFDPSNLLNPGRIVQPRKLDDDLRILVAPPRIPTRAEFASDTRRCVGVGKCLNTRGGVMCPSYRVTREEKHSTRGRAHLLFEMLNGDVVKGGWRSPEVAEALDLCLGCKGCKRDCPVDVDMASYKAEFLHEHYRGRLRPRSHYAMGWLPTWLRFGLVNRFTARFGRFAGLTPERELPTPTTPLVRRLRPLGEGEPVLLFPDTFTNFFEPGIGIDAANVLAHLGNRVELPNANVCCGLTWHSTGQLPKARRVVERTARALYPWTSRGVPVIGLEPSCTAFLRAEAPKLSTTREVRALADATRTFAEHVAPRLPDLPGDRAAVVQTHCHQYAELGFEPDRAALAKAGLRPRVVEGCCGLAGNFGFEQGHYDVSIACAEQELLPALRDDETALVLADGFSCRTQIRHTTDRAPVHLATALAASLGLSPV
ncbi:FAD-binding and (Fe-S)-binding domain-containing protein [Nocardia sp. NRRL S-836]|uniref:FAD-binding and (Fe-S)-binding domain-containing protein n=1 Tax=Nocardia sp. NRRL S-836 TaxID=1519492 RepID=UPI0006ADBE26|nr:FAD-binding and (Fe-S)-binding domain-containing protein [Nocardia sp. NRRL S-836]KOV85045.1 dimethylmenaquinone methyltransferase [Nocardia sp. NRRL S-836]